MHTGIFHPSRQDSLLLHGKTRQFAYCVCPQRVKTIPVLRCGKQLLSTNYNKKDLNDNISVNVIMDIFLSISKGL